ncbi:TPA: hypothetical protein ACIU9A_004463 [Salmonella enterica subsp. enterica serovar Potsdam]|uniref:hypothetical protein n=1 Tax=Salmonella enterica TaxID=28901 RepID=UPI000B4FEE13|nr:hypothetical protein [Salmonella enterica]EBU6211097.1 hypothetical protein [Salmonella enterica subsp. enterica]ELH6756214.1 hypothetical protein [Salmonella enterica subsp. enterica serovar Rubislaw]HDN4684891.1 hypothetical protein [Salmonella enterica subsp. enterica serovar Ball]ASD97569.1 hypothetical protein LFZ35_16430 [Salmonella enterica subsp. enterica serovar Onderstepoort str. SA20060086]EAO1689011.1 hypothetical protein [Salmonella enterica]
MFMLLPGGNRYNPDTFISVRQVYGTAIQNTGLSVAIRSLRGEVVSGGLSLSVPVRAASGAALSGGETLVKPVKSLHGFLLVTTEV